MYKRGRRGGGSNTLKKGGRMLAQQIYIRDVYRLNDANYSRKIIAVLLDKICLLNVLLRPITKLT